MNNSIDINNIVVEEYKKLMTNIIYRNFDKKIRVINITSTFQAEAKTETIYNLSKTYANIGKKVLLIDLDLKNPSIHKRFGIRNNVGLTDLIIKIKNYDEVVNEYNKNLHILTAGSNTKFSYEMIHSERLKIFINEIKELYDIVLIDCPPIELVSDGLVISTISDATILVVKYNAVNKREVSRTYEKLKSVGANVIGTVMTNVDIKNSRYKRNYHEYYKV